MLCIYTIYRELESVYNHIFWLYIIFKNCLYGFLLKSYFYTLGFARKIKVSNIIYRFYISLSSMTDLQNTPAETPEEVSTINVENDLEDLINSSTKPKEPAGKINFALTDEAQKKEDKKQAILYDRSLPKRIMLWWASFVLLLVSLGFGFLFYQYISYQETGKVADRWASYMPWIEKQYIDVIRVLGLQDTSKYMPQQVVTKDYSNSNVVTTIIWDTSRDFLSKKKTLQEWVSQLYQATAKKYDDYDALKKEVGQQWFFPKDIQPIAQWVFFDNSLQKAIVSIESVRFATAMKFFSVLDSFLSQLSSYSSINKETLETQLWEFIKRWEKDINNYIVSCYLNGYEISSTCSTIGDFSNYYYYSDPTAFNQKTFLITMDALESKLENTDFPSLEISMKSIDPLRNTISLNVEINTFKDDEAQLTATKWILNPHIYLVTSIINNLRASRYVLTDSINVNTLKVAKKKIKIGWQTVTVNSSAFDFQLPLQNDVQREIYDFSDDDNK